MCGRYFIDEDDLAEELERILEELNRKNTPENLKTSGEIFPSDVVPVLANSRRQDVQPFAMRWGYSFPGGRPVINARAETAAEKPMFRDGMRQRRCMIPASSYFEWERRDGQKIKYAICPAGVEMLYLAGVYHLENHEGTVAPSFAILTRSAAPEISFIHDRMPVILPPDCAREWLKVENRADEVLRHALQEMEFQKAQ